VLRGMVGGALAVVKALNSAGMWGIRGFAEEYCD